MSEPCFGETMNGARASVLILLFVAFLGCAKKGEPESPSGAGAGTEPPKAPQDPVPVKVEPSPVADRPLTPQEEEALSRRLADALQLRKTLKHDEAVSLLREGLGSDPPPRLASELLFAVGETLFTKGQDATKDKLPGVEPEPCYEEAIKCLEDLVARYPKEEKTARGNYLLGSCFLVLGDLKKALPLYQATFDKYPSFEDRLQTLVRVGVCQAGLGMTDQARQTYQRVLREFPEKENSKTRKYLMELQVAGRQAAPLHVNEWLFGHAGPEGLKGFQGEVVFLVFFATWCENCSGEVPHLRRLISKWTPRGVIFLGIANPKDPKSTMPVQVYVEKNNVAYLDVALDETEASWIPYNVTTLPAGVLIDRKGVVRWRGHPAFFSNPLTETLLGEK